jgi:hypothetical protein
MIATGAMKATAKAGGDLKQMNFTQTDGENLRQLRIEGEEEISKLEQRIAAVRQKLTELGNIEKGLTTGVPVHFISVIDLRGEIPVFETIKQTVKELQSSDRVKAIKLVCEQMTFIKFQNEFGALGFVREETFGWLYPGSFVLDCSPASF